MRTCRLRPEAVRVDDGWLGQQRKLWEARLDRLDALLETMDDERTDDDA